MEIKSIKQKTRKIHLWLGLTSGVIVFIVAITGALYTFKEEIQSWNQEHPKIEIQNKPLLIPSILKNIASKTIPNKELHAIKYNGNDNAVEVIFYKNAPNYHIILYLNPYNGKIIKVSDLNTGFFHFVFEGHMYLWLPHAIGQIIVATGTLFFLFLVITGLILWYPKRNKEIKKRIWFQWKEGIKWKRKNFDLHNIIGLYTSLFALIFIITGLVWGFPWFGYLYYKAVGGEKSMVYQEPISSRKNNKFKDNSFPIDKAWFIMKSEYPKAKSIEIHPPTNDSTSIACNSNPENHTLWKTDYRYFDPYTLEEKKVDHLWGSFKDADNSDKLLRMNYDIHTGAIAGLTGKIFAFLISLLIASLPITGFLIWWGRKNK
ncbi:peptidase M4 [Flavobacterium columnare]|uniref:PepSY-associated TM helix domain-containing protein n=1 Tax=Flavobacterium columnare TaxID=996 RepID=UPI0007F990B3|nr:PepSY-associated TM helix domain-containing protein [Flavobacterium columnare]ANO47635.1 PepSY-associated TM helix domain-containing protein [Flavobacterium columnare]APT21741.1 peptidase M4 [Flavobacterium columnare]MBF6651444.1 peptidase M4 [Flavobacterium columnare]MBF6655199.1 peptidase M4 [Flavobacterium columnare]MBF6658129.1 peptidase M4 [Flavobacterium columnare]